MDIEHKKALRRADYWKHREKRLDTMRKYQKTVAFKRSVSKYCKSDKSKQRYKRYYSSPKGNLSCFCKRRIRDWFKRLGIHISDLGCFYYGSVAENFHHTKYLKSNPYMGIPVCRKCHAACHHKGNNKERRSLLTMGTNMRSIGSRYYTSAHLDEGPIQLTIKKIDVSVEMADGDTQPVMFFEGQKLGFVLGAKCNRIALCDALGDDSDSWIGKTVELYVVETTFKGRPCQGLRVRLPKKGKKK